MRIALEERFWAKVVRTDSCWLWTASRVCDGYGQFRVGSRPVSAHRFAYELLVGPIPDGLQIDHLCRVRHCVNPAHMEPVTQRVNILRGEGITARHAAQTHCLNGHPLVGENLRPADLRRGKRLCLTCCREWSREWYRAKRARLRAQVATESHA